MKKITIASALIATGFLLGASALSALAAGTWTAPTANPPAGNTDTPINVSILSQLKFGGLTIGGSNPATGPGGLTVWGGGVFDTLGVVGTALFNGNVGIGTNNPSTKLDINGTAKMTGLQITTGAGAGKMLTSDANGVGTWVTPASGGTLTGGGTVNYVPKWISATALGNSLIFDNGNNVGIGTNNPATKLSVEKSGGGGLATFKETGFGGIQIDLGNSVGGIQGVDNSLAASTLVLNRNGGNVGIGTINPGAKLDVAGTIKISGGSPGAGKVLTSDASGVGSWQTPVAGGASGITQLSQGSGITLTPNPITTTGSVSADISYLQRRVSGTCPSGAIQTINQDGTVACNNALGGPWTTSGTNIYNSNTGNVGVGTNNPATKLSVEKSGGGGLATFKETGFGGIQIDLGNSVGGIQGVDNSLAASTIVLNRNGGNVGIGTINPGAKLDVNGTVKATGLQLTTGAGSGKVLTSDASGIGSWQPSSSVPNIIATFDSSQTWSVPAGVTRVRVRAWGGGGGGQRSNQGIGGGAGGYGESILSVTPGNNYVITIGAGGSGLYSNGNIASNGGNTSFNTGSFSVTANGGLGGGGGGTGGTAVAGVVVYGQNGRNGSPSDNAGGDGGSSPNGGWGGQGVISGAIGNLGKDGVAPGGGGGSGGGNGGSGAHGRVIIEY